MSRQFAALRGLAIVIVVLYHSIDQGLLGAGGLGYPPPGEPVRTVLLALHELGIFAVPMFLFISGSFAAYAARGDPPRLSWRTVWAGLKRMLWPYLIWSVAFFVLVYFRRDEMYTLWGYLKNLLVGYPFHFIPLLVFWYAASPLLVPVAERAGWLLIGVIVVYQFALMTVIFPGVVGLEAPGWMRFLVPPGLGRTLATWGIYFPLGLTYSLHAARVRPVLERVKWIVLLATGGLFILSLLNTAGILHFPLAAHLCPLVLLGLLPVIQRNAIPGVRQLETVGKRSYGLYLTHLIVLELVFFGVQIICPWLLSHQILLQPLLFAAALSIPLVGMNLIARLWGGRVYRYVFG
ncbi:MAG: acyltransferase [Anaerolineae bacterium]|jgi:peptidoglycan/LPS O-acetylase OafA/YrhL